MISILYIYIYILSADASGIARVNSLGEGKIVAYPEVLQIFNDENYPVRISTQKALIKVAIYEIYAIKWRTSAPPKFTFGGTWLPCPPPRFLCQTHLCTHTRVHSFIYTPSTYRELTHK